VAELHKLNLSNTSKDIGVKVAQKVKPPIDTVTQTIDTAVTATTKPEKHFPIKAVLLIVVIASGILSGWGINRVVGSDKTVAGGSTRGGISTTGISVGDVVGIDESVQNFPDTAEGVLQQGGLEGEGSHHLVRPGGPSQTVYLTSSVVDLDKFIGHRITVWGETFAGQSAGWLMDVGRLRVEELDASLPEDN
jgi:hypothetical protein